MQDFFEVVCKTIHSLKNVVFFFRTMVIVKLKPKPAQKYNWPILKERNLYTVPVSFGQPIYFTRETLYSVLVEFPIFGTKGKLGRRVFIIFSSVKVFRYLALKDFLLAIELF